MTNWIQWEIEDENGENPLGIPAEFEFDVEFDYDPGEPTAIGNEYDPGFEGCPPHTEVVGARCREFRPLLEDTTQIPTKEQDNAISAWFMELLHDDVKLKRQIEACGLDQMYVEPDYDDRDDWDD
jgi:hypothetical protein